jgi:NADH:ubiquinone oxidoreductase subunit E
MVVSEKLDAFFTEKMPQYPTKRSFLVPMCLYTQDELGYLSDEAVAYLAQKTELTQLEVRNVISYYSMLRTKPVGKYNIQVQRDQLLLDAADEAGRKVQHPGVHEYLLHAARRRPTF